MQETLFGQYLKRRYIQTSVVILLGFISLWCGVLESTALVTIVGITLGVDAVAEYADKKLEKVQDEIRN